jgi:lysylphosphatidylglycerol synthetase-like protein (DUF2156 family)
MEKNRPYTLLALAGTTPFIACALLPLIGIDTLPGLGSLDVLASTYGLAIICFLAGAHWGTYLLSQSATPFNLFISSNVVFLAVWFAFIGASLSLSIATQIVAFLVLLFIDYRLRQHAVISVDYFGIRFVATLIATISLLVVLLFR